jgi:hypothetical protein
MLKNSKGKKIIVKDYPLKIKQKNRPTTKMGNDGGSIPKRIDLVRAKAKEVKKDFIGINKMRAKHCAISNQKLSKPIVACRLGYLYNKEVVLGCLIKKEIPPAFAHIQKSKDVKEVKIEEDSEKEFPLYCPLTREVHNGINKFVFLWKCGCMMAKSILKTCRKSKICPVCSKKFKKKNVVSLWDSLESIELKKKIMFEINQKRMERLREEREEEEEMLGKRGPGEELPEYQKAEKKSLEPKNILDGIVKKGFDKDLYQSMFHKSHAVEDANGLIFRNVRFGIR